jgi:hypothetical protein
MCKTLLYTSVSQSYRQSVGLLGRGVSPSQDRCLHKTTQTHNKRRHIDIPRVGFEPPTPAFDRAKTVHVLHRPAI